MATNWRVSWAAFGLVILLLAVPLAWLFIRDDPSLLGLRPYGETEPSLPEKEDGSPGGSPVPSLARMSGPLEATRWAESFRSWPIWQVSGSYFVCGFGFFAGQPAASTLGYVPSPGHPLASKLGCLWSGYPGASRTLGLAFHSGRPQQAGTPSLRRNRTLTA